MRAEFHPEAELELIEAASYYELQVPGLGEDFEVEVRRATDLLQQHPEIGLILTTNSAGSFSTVFRIRLSTACLPLCCTSWWLPIRADALVTGDRG